MANIGLLLQLNVILEIVEASVVAVPRPYNGTVGRLRSRTLLFRRQHPLVLLADGVERVPLTTVLNLGPPQPLSPLFPLLVESELHSRIRQPLVDGQLGF